MKEINPVARAVIPEIPACPIGRLSKVDFMMLAIKATKRVKNTHTAKALLLNITAKKQPALNANMIMKAFPFDG